MARRAACTGPIEQAALRRARSTATRPAVDSAGSDGRCAEAEMGDWLSDSELEQILKIGWTLAAGRDEKELSAAAVREMLSFVGADEVDYNAVDLKTKPRTGRCISAA
jgi:hypothetical protein